jgi:hypothetical protein
MPRVKAGRDFLRWPSCRNPTLQRHDYSSRRNKFLLVILKRRDNHLRVFRAGAVNGFAVMSKGFLRVAFGVPSSRRPDRLFNVGPATPE